MSESRDRNADSPASRWDAFWADHNLQFTNKIVEELERRVDLKDRLTLEIGAGSGTTSIRLAQLGARAVCLDFAANALSLIRKNAVTLRTKADCVKGDAFSLPFRDATFDICFHQGFLEHFKEPAPLLIEQHRILKAGGILLVDVPQRFNVYTLVKRRRMRAGDWFAGWETEFSAGELRRLLEKAGFAAKAAYGRYHFRNLDRIQQRFLGRTVVPKPVERAFFKCVQSLENTAFGCRTAFSVGVVAQKDS